MPLDSLVVFTSVVSDYSCASWSELLALLNADGEIWQVPCSDGVGSGVEPPPLLAVEWVGVSDSESELAASDVFSPVDCSVLRQFGFNLELNTILQRIQWIRISLLLNKPSLAEAIVAVPPSDCLKVSIGATRDVQALASVVSDISN